MKMGYEWKWLLYKIYPLQGNLTDLCQEPLMVIRSSQQRHTNERDCIHDAMKCAVDHTPPGCERILEIYHASSQMEAPMYQDYLHCVDRLQTFKHWPESQGLKLAQAGFFDGEPFDSVKCFYCGLQINQSNISENPAQQHLFLAADCPYLTMCYGSISIPT